MPCDTCGGAMQIVSSDGPTDDGPFTERYECANCGALGFVSGDASDPPSRWTRHGSAFDGGGV